MYEWTCTLERLLEFHGSELFESTRQRGPDAVKSEARNVRSSPSAPEPCRWLEKAEDETDIGLEMEAVETRLWCEAELLLPRIGDANKLDHGLLLTRLLSERRLLCPRLTVCTPAGGAIVVGVGTEDESSAWPLWTEASALCEPREGVARWAGLELPLERS